MTFQNIQDRVFFLTGTSSSDWSLVNFNNAVSRALERVVTLINRSDSRWEYDDTGYLDLNVATLTITSGQQQYSLATSHLSIDRIEIKDSGGNWRRIRQTDQQVLKRGFSGDGISGQLSSVSDPALALGETTPSTGRSGAYLSATGVPLEYDLMGLRLYLFPVPNYTQAKSIKIYFTRGPILFAYTLLGTSATGGFVDSAGAAISGNAGSISSEPGFVSLFHDLISLWPSYDYCLKVGKQNTNQIFAEIVRKEQELVESYGGRNRDVISRLSTSRESNR